MKLFGLMLLTVGFLWLVSDVASGFVSYQHSRWIWQSQRLSEGSTIQRSEAVGAMRELSLALKNRHRLALLPATLMFAGGLMVALGPVRPTSGNSLN